MARSTTKAGGSRTSGTGRGGSSRGGGTSRSASRSAGERGSARGAGRDASGARGSSRSAARGTTWSANDVNALRRFAKENTPTRVIGLKLGRSESSVRGKAQSEGISLKPWNQSPYGRAS